MTVCLDGVFDDDARLSVRDHGLLYGDGVFEGMRMVDRGLFRADDHLRRLRFGLTSLGFDADPLVARAREVLFATCRRHPERDAYIRLVVTRGEGPLGVDPTSCAAPRVFCIADRIALYPDDKRRTGLSLVTWSGRKPSADALDPRVKSLNYLNSVLAKREAKLRGADEALVLSAGGRVAEASAANVFVVRQGVLATPPTLDGALEGITRRSVLALASELGLRSEERSLGRADVLDADECFLTGTGAGLVAVGSLDGATLGDPDGGRPVFDRLVAAFPGYVAAHRTSVD